MGRRTVAWQVELTTPGCRVRLIVEGLSDDEHGATIAVRPVFSER